MYKRRDKSIVNLSFKVFINVCHVIQNRVPVGPLLSYQIVYILFKQNQNLFKNVSKQMAFGSKTWVLEGIQTRVVGIPTDSAALKAMVKFLFLSLGVSVSYGIWSLRYVWSIAQKASPSVHEELKFVISMSLYPIVLFWHHFNSAFLLEPLPPLTNSDNGSDFLSMNESLKW